MADEPAWIPFVSGCVAGGTQAVLLCPLEVVKTRLQSSNSGFPKSPDHWVKSQQAIKQGKASLVAKHRHQQRQLQQANALVHNDIVAGDRRGQTSCRPAPVTATSGARALLSRATVAMAPLSHQYELVKGMSSTAAASPGPGGGMPGGSGPTRRMGIRHCIKFIWVTEGFRGLYKGLGPNLIGIVPGRGIFFFTYETLKSKINSELPAHMQNAPVVHVASTFPASIITSTVTNPIWLIKTRLQLDKAHFNKKLTIRRCAMQIYQEKGLKSFWRGVTASYYGVFETVIYMVLYQRLKQYRQNEWEQTIKGTLNSKPGGYLEYAIDFFSASITGVLCKFAATCSAYPHEVARTRLREPGTKYNKFWQTLFLTRREEGYRGLYRGLWTHLMRQLPSTAIIWGTYEIVSTTLNRWQLQSAKSAKQLSYDLRDAANDSCQKTPVRN